MTAPADTPPNRFATVLKYLRQHRASLVFGGACILLTNLLALIIPYITKLIFDLLESNGSSTEILQLVLLSLGLAIGSGVFRFMVRRTIIWTSRHIEYQLRGDLFAHLLKLPPSFYHENRTGDIMARATNDLEAVRMMIGPGIMQISNTIVKVAVAIGFMLYLSPELTLYALAPMVVFPVVANRLGNLVHKRFIRIQEHFAELTAAVQENIAGIRVIRAYRQEEPETEHFNRMSNKYIGLNMDMARLYGLFFPLIMLLASGLNLAVLYLGGRQVMDGAIPLGTLVAFFAYLSMLLWPSLALGWVVSLYQRGTASLDRINRILRTEPAVQDGTDRLCRDRITGKIEFRDLTFSYNGRTVLDHINVTIRPGETIGLLGLTGSGKTTLVSLLPRLFPVQRGQIFIDNRDLNDWELQALRRQIGFATQEPFLFSDTVANNIRFGAPDADNDQIEAVAATASLTKDVETFPNGFATMVGERGITLSGGQKQRTTIARAILVGPAILILDDATSSVDTETEHEISQRIKAVLKNRTAIVISHRVSSVKEADRILYLRDGRIVEEGTHEALLKLNGDYAELHRSQLLEMELEQL